MPTPKTASKKMNQQEGWHQEVFKTTPDVTLTCISASSYVSFAICQCKDYLGYGMQTKECLGLPGGCGMQAKECLWETEPHLREKETLALIYSGQRSYHPYPYSSRNSGVPRH